MRYRTSGAASPLHTLTASTSRDPLRLGPVTHPLGSRASALLRHSAPPGPARRHLTGSVHQLGSAQPRSGQFGSLGSVRLAPSTSSAPFGPARSSSAHSAPLGPRAWPLSARRTQYLLTSAPSGPRATCWAQLGSTARTSSPSSVTCKAPRTPANSSPTRHSGGASPT